MNFNQRIVHLDLKGAPLKIPYLEKVILSAKSWGATGILLEWEDTFPYTGILSDIGSINGKEGMYSETEVRYIMDIAKKNELEVIQLIQTIGHLEFVLKHPQFRCLRESPRSPAVLCPSKPESQLLIRSMLEQALDLQPEANYLHIGADEVWHMGVCSDCKEKAAASPYGAASLFLNHIRDIILFIKERRPNLTILMWDDMLRGINPDILGAFNLGDLVQPVIWDYNTMEYFRINPNLWNKYNRIFPQVWAGSAFKGANGSCKISSPVSRYVSNHEAWLQEITTYKHRINFSGIILTGWSRSGERIQFPPAGLPVVIGDKTPHSQMVGYLPDCIANTSGLKYVAITLVTRFQSPLREQQRICKTFGVAKSIGDGNRFPSSGRRPPVC